MSAEPRFPSTTLVPPSNISHAWINESPKEEDIRFSSVQMTSPASNTGGTHGLMQCRVWESLVWHCVSVNTVNKIQLGSRKREHQSQRTTAVSLQWYIDGKYPSKLEGGNIRLCSVTLQCPLLHDGSGTPLTPRVALATFFSPLS